MNRTWIPYDQTVYAEECPGDNYYAEHEIWVTGPDADGLVWVHATTPDGQTHGAVSVRADSIAGRAFAAYAAKPPAPSAEAAPTNEAKETSNG
jgi:hypothetical protein